jgi:nitrogenase subunit NifH
MAEFAIYGKGGIGKSTISANISAALAKRGRRVLQIGCDPKHDSTRLLLNGERLTTVLDYLKVTSPDKCRLADIVRAGVFGVHCLEAGGPEPGVGCAGRGILTTFELIDRL